ncbi:MAG: TGS domain-containing protein [Pyrinomonadaceae bacterium]
MIATFLRKTPVPTKTIVTSRRLFSLGEGERFIRLPTLLRPEGIELIQHTSKHKDVNLSEQQIQSLFDLCNGIPAAIVWSIGRMVITSPKLVLHDLENFHNLNELTKFCFNSAFDSLQVHHMEAAKAFLSLSIFPFPLTQEMLREILQSQRINNFNKVLEELTLLSLIKNEGEQIETLPIVRDFARSKLKHEIEIDEELARQHLARFISSQENDDFIRVFTPTNEIIKLPKGATPVDFAYKIHTNIGNHFVSSIVNGYEAKPDSYLNDGDRIEIITHFSSSGPTLNWASTELAKRSIRNKNRVILRVVQPIRKGNTFSRNGNLKDSIREYDLAISIEPSETWARNRRGHTLRLLGDLKGATIEHEMVLTLSPGNHFAYCGLGFINYQKGWLNEAEEYFRKALESKPDYVNAMCGLGRILCRKRDYPSAEILFREAIRLSVQLKDKTPWLYLYLFIALFNQGIDKFIQADENLSICLKQFFKRVGVRGEGYKHVGSHTFYQYSVGLMFGNSPNYKDTLEKAISICAALGLREEIIADLDMITLDSWSEWEAYAAKITSNPSLGVKSTELIYYLRNVPARFVGV